MWDFKKSKKYNKCAFKHYAQTLTALTAWRLCPAHLDTGCCRCSSVLTCPHRRLPHWEEWDLCKCENVSAHRDHSVHYRETSLSTMTSLHSLYVRKKGKRWTNTRRNKTGLHSVVFIINRTGLTAQRFTPRWQWMSYQEKTKQKLRCPYTYTSLRST